MPLPCLRPPAASSGTPPCGETPQRPLPFGATCAAEGGPPLLGVGRQDAPSGPRLPALLAFGSAGRVPRLAPSSTPLRGPSTQAESALGAGLRPRSPAERGPLPFRLPSGLLRPWGFAVGGQGQAPGLPVGGRGGRTWGTPWKTTSAPTARPGRPPSGVWCSRAGSQACSWRPSSLRGRSPPFGALALSSRWTFSRRTWLRAGSSSSESPTASKPAKTWWPP